MRGFRELDRILRGDAMRVHGPGQAILDIPLLPLVSVNMLLAAVYGACMGFFGVFGRAEPEVRFIVADAVKVPLLFLLTLVVTFPSLYVFNALVGSRLGCPISPNSWPVRWGRSWRCWPRSVRSSRFSL